MAFGDGKEVLDHAKTQVPRRPRRIEREIGVHDVECSLVEREDVLRDRPDRDLKVEFRESRGRLDAGVGIAVSRLGLRAYTPIYLSGPKTATSHTATLS
jgi:hypothetical protein